jgi:hypothetical protein
MVATVMASAVLPDRAMVKYFSVRGRLMSAQLRHAAEDQVAHYSMNLFIQPA